MVEAASSIGFASTCNASRRMRASTDRSVLAMCQQLCNEGVGSSSPSFAFALPFGECYHTAVQHFETQGMRGVFPKPGGSAQLGLGGAVSVALVGVLWLQCQMIIRAESDGCQICNSSVYKDTSTT